MGTISGGISVNQWALVLTRSDLLLQNMKLEKNWSVVGDSKACSAHQHWHLQSIPPLLSTMVTTTTRTPTQCWCHLAGMLCYHTVKFRMIYKGVRWAGHYSSLKLWAEVLETNWIQQQEVEALIHYMDSGWAESRSQGEDPNVISDWGYKD